MGWILFLMIVLVLAAGLVPILIFVHMITPSKTLARIWGGFYSIDLGKITIQSADNVRMLSMDQIDAFESRLDQS